MIAFRPLQVSVQVSTVLDAAAEIGGLALVAAAVAGAVAIAYRWYARERVSNPPAVLIALATVAAYLNATTALGQVMGANGGTAALSVRVAAFNVSALAAGTVAGLAGTAVGDHLASTVRGGPDQVAVDDSLSRVVRAVGRVIAIELPDEIEDVPGYDPVDPDTRATLEGKTFVFPRGLTVETLGDRLTRRLREDYRVGHVDIEIDEDGTVTHLGLGARAAGIGPTLPPESAAMAIRADPAYAASAGDLVQVWKREPHRRLINAEVRGTANEVVTLAIDAADASKLSPETRYKLVTLPVEERADRELTELLRAAEETLGVVEIDESSSLAGVPVGALDVTVVAIHAGGPDDRIEALPERNRVISAGDSVYVIARPDAIRRIESAGSAGVDERASSTSTAVVESSPPASTAADDTSAEGAKEHAEGTHASDETVDESETTDHANDDGDETSVDANDDGDETSVDANDDGDETSVDANDHEREVPSDGNDEPDGQDDQTAAESVESADDKDERDVESATGPIDSSDDDERD